MAAPLKTIRFGPVSLSIWENDQKTSKGTFKVKSCQLVKNYFDEKSGSWKATNNYKVAELVNIVQCCQEALNELYRRDNSKEDETDGEPIPF